LDGRAAASCAPAAQLARRADSDAQRALQRCARAPVALAFACTRCAPHCSSAAIRAG
jgi:hypothetical protein